MTNLRNFSSVTVIVPIASYTFLKDPMRNSNVPDILGQFIDPMGGRATYTQGIDPTNTGA
ncbi:hypothetical protein INT45_008152 [Circinella minor]|uniref:Uncharacterized protein n=1 Tax=Circinella minor TaxID=1195481 RepID=A0A8H7RW07_9FUNG|nr:hypothetical protein INT45_008152 [Circinella minor]